VLLGKSMLGRQLNDLMRTVSFAQSRFGVARGDLGGVARGTLGPLLLHAAALEEDFGRVALIESPLSYRSIVDIPRYAANYISAAVPGALTAYALPDLAACAAPRKLLLIDPRDGANQPADDGAIELDTAVVVQAYSATPRENLRILGRAEKSAMTAAWEAWLR
jgi:hypothetical protein